MMASKNNVVFRVLWPVLTERLVSEGPWFEARFGHFKKLYSRYQ
jgi:hypothetical protein